jgi:hypothetical protein
MPLSTTGKMALLIPHGRENRSSWGENNAERDYSSEQACPLARRTIDPV